MPQLRNEWLRSKAVRWQRSSGDTPWELTGASLPGAPGHGGTGLQGQNDAGNSGNLTRGSCSLGGGENGRVVVASSSQTWVGLNVSSGAPLAMVRGVAASATSDGPPCPDDRAWVNSRWLGVDDDMQMAVNWFGRSEGGGGVTEIYKVGKHRHDP
jgi:hypothetical protein